MGDQGRRSTAGDFQAPSALTHWILPNNDRMTSYRTNKCCHPSDEVSVGSDDDAMSVDNADNVGDDLSPTVSSDFNNPAKSLDLPSPELASPTMRNLERYAM
jgi:hypothetical protein